jgi:phosphate transport system substrate-binding protein
MNDEFLSRIRKTPPPGFLEELKGRLDQQPLAPPPRRRWTLVRGVLAGLMLGGAAFAITAVSLTGRPGSLRSFVSTPLRFVAQLLPGRAGSGEHPERDYRTHAVPLGPVWLPEHPGAGSGAHTDANPGSPKIATASLTAPAKGSGGSGGSVGGYPALGGLKVLAPSTLYPIVSIAVNKLAQAGLMLPSARVSIELDPGKGTLDRLCTSDAGGVDFVALPRRITRDEYTRCNGPRSFGIVEVKIGYQALVLARARLYEPLKLSARDLFLALARRIPDPNRPGTVIDNPNTTWNQVDPALPYDRIQILGPALDSAPAKLLARLLIRPGCSTFPWIAALWESDPEQYDEICGALREDGAYVPSSASGWAYSNLLTTNPTALGIFSLNDFRLSHDGLVLNPIDGLEAAPSNISNGAYPAARPLYLYARGDGPLGNQVFMAFVRYNMALKDVYGRDPDGWGFVALDKAESDANLAIAQERRNLRF